MSRRGALLLKREVDHACLRGGGGAAAAGAQPVHLPSGQRVRDHPAHHVCLRHRWSPGLKSNLSPNPHPATEIRNPSNP